MCRENLQQIGIAAMADTAEGYADPESCRLLRFYFVRDSFRRRNSVEHGTRSFLCVASIVIVFMALVEGASKTAPLEKARFIRDLKEICLKYKHAHSLKCSPFKNAVLFRFLKI